MFTRIHTCLFCVARNTKYLELIFCMFMGYTISYIRDFFQYFWKLLSICFNFFKRAGALMLGSQSNFSQSYRQLSFSSRPCYYPHHPQPHGFEYSKKEYTPTKSDVPSVD